MHHTCVFFQQSTGTATNKDLPAVTDGWATVQNGHFIFQEPMDLWLPAFFSDQGTAASLNTPHWRFVGQPQIVPVTQTWDGVESLISDLYGPRYITVPAIDEVQALVSTAATATAGDMVAIWLGKKPMNLNLPAGDVYPINATATIPAASYSTGAWIPANITFTQSLPAGRYAVLGMDVVEATTQLCRLRFQQYVMLPGTWVRNGATGATRDIFRKGRLGVWGEFDNTAQPTIEAFSVVGGATGSFNITLDLVKIR